MNPALTIDHILTQIKAALEAFAQGLGGGTVSIAMDPFNVFELLAANPVGYRLILHWAGDSNVADAYVPLIRHKIEIIFGSNLGLTAKPDLALIQAVGARPPILSQVDAVRATVLGLQFPSEPTGGILEYDGAETLVTPEGFPLAAYKLTFGLRALPAQPQQPTQL
jgi:hypothetical protein